MSSTASSFVAEKNNAQTLPFSKKAIVSLCVVVAAAIIAVCITPTFSAGQARPGPPPCAPTSLQEQSGFGINANFGGVNISAGGGAGGSSMDVKIGKNKGKLVKPKKTKKQIVNIGGSAGEMDVKFGQMNIQQTHINPAVVTTIVEEPPTLKVEKEITTTTELIPEQETVVPLQFGLDVKDPYDREKLNDRIFLGKALGLGMACLFLFFVMCIMGPKNGQFPDDKFPIWYSILMPVTCAGIYFPGVWFCWKDRANNSSASDLDSLHREAEPEREETTVTERTIVTEVPGKKKKQTTVVEPVVVHNVDMTVPTFGMTVNTPGMSVSAPGVSMSINDSSKSVSKKKGGSKKKGSKKGGMSVSVPGISMSIDDDGMDGGASFHF